MMMMLMLMLDEPGFVGSWVNDFFCSIRDFSSHREQAKNAQLIRGECGIFPRFLCSVAAVVFEEFRNLDNDPSFFGVL